jgi:hypothetical protein
MAFKASKVGKGVFEVHGLEAFIEKKLAELRRALGLEQSPKSKPKAAPRAKPSVPKRAAAAPVESDALTRLLADAEAHPLRAALLKAGKQKDQLLRSLIPLFISRGAYEVTSGTTSKFWAKHGVTYAAPNAAKALREHAGYARRTAKGNQITPNGIKYVEQALAGGRRA